MLFWSRFEAQAMLGNVLPGPAEYLSAGCFLFFKDFSDLGVLVVEYRAQDG
jgi:hypothetical protein